MEPILTDEDRAHLDRALEEIDKRVQLRKIIDHSEGVRELWEERVHLGKVIHTAAAVLQRYSFSLDGSDLSEEDREGVQHINEAFNLLRITALKYQ